MSESSHSVVETEILLSDLGATCEEIISASGWTLGELEAAALRAGRLRDECCRIPMFSDDDIARLRQRIRAERSRFADFGRVIRSRS